MPTLYHYNRFMDAVDDNFNSMSREQHSELKNELTTPCPFIERTMDLSDCLHWLPDQGSVRYVYQILYFFYLYGYDENIIFDEDDLRIFYIYLAYNSHFGPNSFRRVSKYLRMILLDYKEFDADETDYESE